MTNLKELIDKKKFSVNYLLSELLSKSKLKHISVVIADRLNSKGVTNYRGGVYYPSNVANSLYYPERLVQPVADEVYEFLKENGVTDEQINAIESN